MIGLKEKYKDREKSINIRLREFKDVCKNAIDEDIFAELCFCLFTPQSRAVVCDKAVRALKKKGLLLKGTKSDIRAQLKGVRFPNNKTSYLLAARKIFIDKGKVSIKSILNTNDILGTRDWLVKNIKGLGYKEASHFLRNIGFGSEIAILDVHILKNLKRYGVIREIPTSISKKVYLDIESKMKKFSCKIKIPLDAMDLLFWSMQTGYIFK